MNRNKGIFIREDVGSSTTLFTCRSGSHPRKPFKLIQLFNLQSLREKVSLLQPLAKRTSSKPQNLANTRHLVINP